MDCRDAATRAMSKYGEDWQTKEIHFNRRESHCYLSLEGSEANTVEGRRMYTDVQKVVDVDENRDILTCASTRERGTAQEWLCTGPDGQSITHDRFIELRKVDLEK